MDSQNDLWSNYQEKVLCSLINQPDYLSVFAERMDPSLFPNTACKITFMTLRDIWNRDGKVDPLGLCREVSMISDGRVTAGQAMGIAMYHLERWVVDIFNHEISILEEYRTLNSLQSIGEELAKARTVDDTRELIQRALASILPPSQASHTISMDESFYKVVDELESVMAGKPMNRGVPTGIPTLDRVTGGCSKRKLWIISGETSDGKSVLGQNIMRSFASHGENVAIYSWEMPDEDITRRTMADVTGFDLGIFTGDVPMTKADQEKIKEASRWMTEHGKRIQIVNAASLSFHDVESDIRLKVNRDKISLVVIDYLQLMDIDDLAKQRDQQISKACARLYRLAQALDFTIIILSQLNDDGLLRESRTPGMDCDVSVAIQKVKNADGTSNDQRRTIFIGKNRGGRRNVAVPAAFIGQHARFMEMDKRDMPEPVQNKKPFNWRTKK